MATTKPKPQKPAQPTHLSVRFVLVTPDQLRRIIFTLSKTSTAKDNSWSVFFQVDERADENGKFRLVAQLQVDVDHNDKAKAEATAKHGLDTDQQSQAMVAADTAKDVTTGDATLDEAKEDAKSIVPARSDDSPN